MISSGTWLRGWARIGPIVEATVTALCSGRSPRSACSGTQEVPSSSSAKQKE